MPNPPLRRPLVVTTTIVLLGLVSFLSAISFGQSTDGPAQSVAWLLRTVATTAAFIAALSGSKLGRRLVIAWFAIFCAGAAFGIPVAIQSLAANPFPSIAALILIAAFYFWAYSYSLGSASRSYYAALWNSKLPEVMSA